MFTSTLPPPSAATHFPGLSTAEAASARAAHGFNVLPDNAPTGLLAFGLVGYLGGQIRHTELNGAAAGGVGLVARAGS